MKQKSKIKKYIVYLDTEMVKQVRHILIEKEWNFSELIRHLLYEFLERHGKKA